MSIPHIQVEWNHWRIPSVRPDEICRVIPEPDAPRGRKAREMASLWAKYRGQGAPGVLWQDPDIVADPDDVAEMIEAARKVPAYVHCSVHKLWPASTMREDWVWAHGEWRNGYPELSQRIAPRAGWFALGLTYTPGRLLDLAAPHMFQWVFGQVDNGLAAIARQHGIPAYPVLRARPKHLHFYPREDDASWRPGSVNDR